MIIKKGISAFLSFVCISIGFNSIASNAVVIEPEIVKSETWTTSYYIDDDETTLYPYIECKADIYSDGTVKCYFWNTHEWDGFVTVSHRATVLSSKPYSTDSIEYCFYTGKEFKDFNGLNNIPVSSSEGGNPKMMNCDFSFWQNRDISYYPPQYGYMEQCYSFSNTSLFNFYYVINDYYDYVGNAETGSLSCYSYKGALPNMPVNKECIVTFKPKVDPVDTYKIRFLGHDITVSPDILSSHIVATPQLTEQEKYIAELEKKNLELTEEIARLKADPSVIKDDITRLDANGDGFVNAVDASIVLSIYAYNSTNQTPIKTISDYYNTLT